MRCGARCGKRGTIAASRDWITGLDGLDKVEERRARSGAMIRKLKSGEFRLYSRKVDPRTGRRRNLGTFTSRSAAEKHEREIQYFKRRG